MEHTYRDSERLYLIEFAGDDSYSTRDTSPLAALERACSVYSKRTAVAVKMYQNQSDGPPKWVRLEGVL